MGSMAPFSNPHRTNMEDTKFDLKSRSLIVNESNQTNAKMLEKVEVSTWPRDIWGSGGLPQEKFSKTTLCRMSENALLLSKKSCLHH